MRERAVTSEARIGGEPTTRRAGVIATVGGVLAAFGAALCCIGPLLFVTFGVGAGLASTFEPLRPLFTGLAVLGLGFGFHAVYGRHDGACAPGEACEVPRSRRRDEVLLWSATVLAAVLWSFNHWSIFLL